MERRNEMLNPQLVIRKEHGGHLDAWAGAPLDPVSWETNTKKNHCFCFSPLTIKAKNSFQISFRLAKAGINIGLLCKWSVIKRTLEKQEGMERFYQKKDSTIDLPRVGGKTSLSPGFLPFLPWSSRAAEDKTWRSRCVCWCGWMGGVDCSLWAPSRQRRRVENKSRKKDKLIFLLFRCLLYHSHCETNRHTG